MNGWNKHGTTGERLAFATDQLIEQLGGKKDCSALFGEDYYYYDCDNEHNLRQEALASQHQDWPELYPAVDELYEDEKRAAGFIAGLIYSTLNEQNFDNLVSCIRYDTKMISEIEDMFSDLKAKTEMSAWSGIKHGRHNITKLLGETT